MILTKSNKLINPEHIVEIDSKPEQANYTHKGIVYVHFVNGSCYRLHTTDYIPTKEITKIKLLELLKESNISFVTKKATNESVDLWESQEVV